MSSPRLDNPYLPKAEKPDSKGAHSVIRLWSGGAHTEAKALAASLKLTAKDTEAIAAACPGWNG